MTKITYCSFRGPRFSSKHTHGSSQLPKTPVPGDVMHSFDLHRLKTHMWYTDTHSDTGTYTHIKYKFIFIYINKFAEVRTSTLL